MEQTFMKEKKILPLVLTMSLPMVLSMMVNSLYNIIDSYFVAKISEDAMTALSLVFPLQNLVNAVTIGFGVGINAVIAYYLGAQEQEKGDQAAIPGFLRFFTSEEMVVELGIRYSRIVFGFAVVISLNLSFEKIFQAVGKMTVSCLNVILSGFSQSYVLVLGVYYKLQTFLYLTANGIVQGIRPLIGYNYGAGMYERVGRIYRTALYLILSIMTLGTVLCLLFPAVFMGFFTDSPKTLEMGASALRIICIGFPVSSVSVTACGALEGLGMGKPSLVISSCRYLLLMVPAAYVLSRVFGAAGVWHGFWVSEFLTAAVAAALYGKAVRFRR